MWQRHHRQVKYEESDTELRVFLQIEGFAQNKQESSLSPRMKYYEETDKLVYRMMTNQITSPHTSLISTWDNLKS